ncbi:MAG: complex I NDUFA9 subunit family protein [Betaproteobacteria bacterium]|nr:MAG: complex I NDUFA9 subunit family protein [Betaproteobacteria bacterium]
MIIENVTILGGSGFVGKRLAQLLSQRGIAVTVPTRYRERAKSELIVLPTVSVVEADIHSDADLDHVLAGTDAVINLVGILHETRKGAFERAHVELAVKVLEACRRAGVRRLLHMSALGADPEGPSRYLRSKGEGEARMLHASDESVAVTAFRPSVIFGRGDSFLTLFAKLLRMLPVVALGSPKARFQPVWVEDVVRAFADALADPATFGRRYDLCGPKVYTLRELIELTGKVTGYSRPIIGLGPRASYLQALAMEWLPVKLLTRDNLRSMSVDNVCECAWPEVFAFQPSALEGILPTYLSPRTTRGYDLYRTRARR